jgi:hypothetical protein
MQMSLRALFLGAVLAALSLQGAAACQGSRMVFQDRFNNLDPAWGNDDNATASGGRLVLQVPQGNGGFADHLLNQSNVYGDIDECITVRFTQSTDQAGSSAGLVFWGADDSHYYMLVVTPIGQFIAMRKVADNRNLVPISWTPTSAVHQGLNATNELEVITQGNQANLFVNGVKVGQLTGQPPETGSLVGVYWSTLNDRNVVVEFSDLRVMN